MDLQNGTKFGSLTEEALLHIWVKVGELWPRRSPGAPKYWRM